MNTRIKVTKPTVTTDKKLGKQEQQKTASIKPTDQERFNKARKALREYWDARQEAVCQELDWTLQRKCWRLLNHYIAQKIELSLRLMKLSNR